MAVGDLAEVVVKYAGFPGTVLNTFGFRAKDAGATFQNLASAFQTAMVKNTSGGLLRNVQNTIQCSEIEVHDVHPGTTATLLHSFASVAGSSSTGEMLPPQCSLVLSWSTAQAGRSFKGRTFLTGYPESQQATGTWISAQLTDANAIVTNLLGTFGPSGTDLNWTFVVISRVSNGAPRVPPIGTVVTSGAARGTVYTQRRRVAGHGA